MSTYILLPGVREKIQQTMARLHIRPVRSTDTVDAAIRQRARFYMTPVMTEKKQVVWFKASLQSSPYLRRGLRDEMKVQKLFAAYEKHRRPRFDSPSYIAGHDDHRGFLWLMRHYWTGIYAGDMSERFGLSYGFFRNVTPVMMANVLHDVRSMTSYVGPRLKLYTHDIGWYTLDFRYYQQPFFRPLLKHALNPGWTRDDIDRLEELLVSHRSFLRTRATVFSHGDLYPNNIMVRPGSARPVVLFDWEQAHLNLAPFDAVMVYLMAWRKPAWQAAFKKHTFRLLGRQETTALAWRLSLLSLSVRLTAFAFIRLTNQQPERFTRLTKGQIPVFRKLFTHYMSHLQEAYVGATKRRT